MLILSIFVIMLLWVASIFTFAKWRYPLAFTPERPGNISADPVFQIYLKLSGLGVLVWIGLMLAGS